MSGDVLTVAANIAAVATAFVAVVFFCQFHLTRRSHRRRLETYLKDCKDDPEGLHQRTVLALIAELGIPESEIVEASFRSKHIARRVTVDQYGAASKLLLEYEANP